MGQAKGSRAGGGEQGRRYAASAKRPGCLGQMSAAWNELYR